MFRYFNIRNFEISWFQSFYISSFKIFTPTRLDVVIYLWLLALCTCNMSPDIVPFLETGEISSAFVRGLHTVRCQQRPQGILGILNFFFYLLLILPPFFDCLSFSCSHGFSYYTIYIYIALVGVYLWREACDFFLSVYPAFSLSVSLANEAAATVFTTATTRCIADVNATIRPRGELVRGRTERDSPYLGLRVYAHTDIYIRLLLGVLFGKARGGPDRVSGRKTDRETCLMSDK